ncbi:MAG: hypothetical protein GXO88_08990 [Chlorobi bacterium]|nr:hypothetical protein [Chlorobiota bacterium]
MKKTVLIFAALIAVSSLSAQGRGRGNMKGQVNCQNQGGFAHDKMKTELEKQQIEFYAVLSKKEKAKVESLKSELDDLMETRKGTTDVDQQRAFRDRMYKIRKDAEKIADRHPDQSKKYTAAVIKFKESLNNGYKGQGRGPKPGKANGFGNQGMGQMNDAAWLLLWDAERQMSMRGMRNHGRMNMRGGNFRGGMGALPPEIKDEIRDFAIENILPAIAEKRKTFDSKLNETEKKEIIFARGNLMAREAMYKQWHESDDFVLGERRKDTALDNFRDEMRESMMAVRTISLNHSKEIDKIREDLRPKAEIWKEELKAILVKTDIDASKTDPI